MGVEPLPVGSQVVVRRAKPGKGDVVYAMTVESDDGDHVVVAGPFSEPSSRDLGYVRFEPADHFVEHFWRSRWYTVADVRDPVRGRKGWYCDVSRPAATTAGSIVSTDLTDPQAADQALRALDELRRAAPNKLTTLLA
jgi:Protein of unknown function (DUF402)